MATDKYGNQIDLADLPKSLRKELQLEIEKSQLRSLTQQLERSISTTQQPLQRTTTPLNMQSGLGAVLMALGLLMGVGSVWGNHRYDAGYAAGLAIGQKEAAEANQRANQAEAQSYMQQQKLMQIQQILGAPQQ